MAWIYLGDDKYAGDIYEIGATTKLHCPKCKTVIHKDVNNAYKAVPNSPRGKKPVVMHIACPMECGVDMQMWFSSSFEAKKHEYRDKAKIKTWQVPGSNGATHTVTKDKDGWHCTCQDHRIRKRDCKHIKSKQ